MWGEALKFLYPKYFASFEIDRPMAHTSQWNLFNHLQLEGIFASLPNFPVKWPITTKFSIMNMLVKADVRMIDRKPYIMFPGIFLDDRVYKSGLIGVDCRLSQKIINFPIRLAP